MPGSRSGTKTGKPLGKVLYKSFCYLKTFLKTGKCVASGRKDRTGAIPDVLRSHYTLAGPLLTLPFIFLKETYNRNLAK